MLSLTFFATFLQKTRALQSLSELLEVIEEQLPRVSQAYALCVNGEELLSHGTLSEHSQTFMDAPFSLELDFAKNALPDPDALQLLTALMFSLLKNAEQSEASREALRSLRKAQGDLIEVEKMASLGALVNGMAHELNTPLGIGVTAVSALQEDLNQLERAVASGTLTQGQMTRGIGFMQEAAGLLQTHLQVAARLVENFKQISAQQVSETFQSFDIRAQSQAVFTTLQYEFEQCVNFKVIGNFTDEFTGMYNGYPGVWTQVLSELVRNSFAHAWPAATMPDVVPEITLHIAIHTEQEDSGITALFDLMDERLEYAEGEGKSWEELQKQELVLTFSDNGVGVSEALREHVFEPFSTRDKSHFGGLGLHMVYNLVHQKLAGEIHLVQSVGSPGEGAIFEIRLPLES